MFKELAIHRVVAVKILDVRQMHGALDDVADRAARRVQNLFDMPQRQQGFLFDRSAHRLGRFGVQRPLPAHIDPAVHFHRGRICARAFFLFRMIDLFFLHD